MSRILLVDDDEEFLMLLGEHLSLRFLKFDLATSVEQAKRFMRSTRYRMIVSDLNMPIRIRPVPPCIRQASRYPLCPYDRVRRCEHQTGSRKARDFRMRAEADLPERTRRDHREPAVVRTGNRRTGRIDCQSANRAQLKRGPWDP